ncbi:V-type ATP synthase subunit F [Brucepastera parasyntrophica]|uniref:V-type ATP synthase subunit F n=1 Tax=Brucepastera parasyntrophica TaxID=2880008 RepID=UPI0021087B69|nr:V-type ATP synthase subunit F [Brucepastera parasyntrophica]ULQ60354.1 V-type ATP synthase subunit F [Brucepastera parasyntrophica]
MKYCFIGERELVLAFALVGVNGIIANTPEEARDAFFRVTGRGNMLAGGTPSVEERPRILILTEDVSSMLGEEVSNWQMGTEYPLIVEIPGLHGHLPDRKSLTEAIRDAIGIHV